MAQKMAMARVYNKMTGANITHKDVDEWGFTEQLEIEFATELLEDSYGSG